MTFQDKQRLGNLQQQLETAQQQLQQAQQQAQQAQQAAAAAQRQAQLVAAATVSVVCDMCFVLWQPADDGTA